jgi:hypothetical protein
MSANPTSNGEDTLYSTESSKATGRELHGTQIDTDKSEHEEDATPHNSFNHVSGHPNPNDPNIVWWDSDDDPHNPMNWSATKKWGTIALLSFLSFLTLVKLVKTILIPVQN